MGIKDKKIGILIENNYEDLEFWYPYLRLQEEGITATIIGPESKTYNSKHGYQVEADVTAEKAIGQSFDAIIIPGGYAPDAMRTVDEMVNLVKQTHEQGHLVAAICHAAWMLASADIIRHKNVTCFHSIKDDIKNAGATYHDESVVIDDNIITSRIPDDLPNFCKSIINWLHNH